MGPPRALPGLAWPCPAVPAGTCRRGRSRERGACAGRLCCNGRARRAGGEGVLRVRSRYVGAVRALSVGGGREELVLRGLWVKVVSLGCGRERASERAAGEAAWSGALVAMLVLV